MVRSGDNMKMTILLVAVLFVVMELTTQAQVVQTPIVAGDKDLADRGVKNRSIDLERVDRDARLNDANSRQSGAASAARFAEIKSDFESLQRLEDEIVKEYTMSRNINRAKIAANAGQINTNATRLAKNLFPVVDEPKKKKRKKEEATP